MSTADERQSFQDQKVQELVHGWVDALIRDGEPVEVTILHEAAFSTVVVKGSEETISSLVGVKGQMARALRTLLAGASTKLGRRYALDLMPLSRS